MINYESRFSDELMHHGIKGQQWGDRNGPPYPLDKKAHKRVISSSGPKSKADVKELKKKKKEQKKAWKLQKKEKKRFDRNMKILAKKEKKREDFYKKQEELQKKRESELEAERAKRDKKFKESAGKLSDLSNEELKARTARLDLEAAYRQKLEQARPQKNHEVANILKKSAGVALGAAATAGMTYVGKRLIAKMLHPERLMSDKEEKGFYKDLFKRSFSK